MGEVLSPIPFTVYVNDQLGLLSLQLGSQNKGCHMDGNCIGVVICTNDITLLGSTHNSVINLKC